MALWRFNSLEVGSNPGCGICRLDDGHDRFVWKLVCVKIIGYLLSKFLQIAIDNSTIMDNLPLASTTKAQHFQAIAHYPLSSPVD